MQSYIYIYVAYRLYIYRVCIYTIPSVFACFHCEENPALTKAGGPTLRTGTLHSKYYNNNKRGQKSFVKEEEEEESKVKKKAKGRMKQKNE